MIAEGRVQYRISQDLGERRGTSKGQQGTWRNREGRGGDDEGRRGTEGERERGEREGRVPAGGDLRLLD